MSELHEFVEGIAEKSEDEVDKPDEAEDGLAPIVKREIKRQTSNSSGDAVLRIEYLLGELLSRPGSVLLPCPICGEGEEDLRVLRKIIEERVPTTNLFEDKCGHCLKPTMVETYIQENLDQVLTVEYIRVT